MSFQPNPGDEMVINGAVYQVGQHPAAPGLAYAQAGRQGIVYQLVPAQGGLHEAKALKVFFPKYRIPAMVYQSENMELYSESPGLQVCKREVLTPEKNESLIAEYPDLLYAVLMPWIHGWTWFDVITDQRGLHRGESLSLAKALAGIGSGMEQWGLAHCDLSAPNVMLPFFSEVGLPGQRTAVELVDVEQMYSPKMDRPDVLLAGSPGYAAHRTVHSGLWSAYADRFAGAVIISEMLGWCDPAIAQKAWGESYFDQHELQNPCERYFHLKKSLELNWGVKVAELFTRAWESEDLSSCPTFGEWLITLSTVKEADRDDAAEYLTGENSGESAQGSQKPEAVKDTLLSKESPTVKTYTAAAAEHGFPTGNPDDGNQGVVNRLFSQAREMEEKGNLKGALEVYRSAHHFVSRGSPLEVELEAAIHELEAGLNVETAPRSPRTRSSFYRSLRWILSCVVACILIAGSWIAVTQIMADHGSAKTEKQASPSTQGASSEAADQIREDLDAAAAKQAAALQQAEQKRLQDEAEQKKQIEKLQQQAKEAERKKLQQQYDNQAKYDAYLKQQKENELQKAADRKKLKEMYDKQVQYEAYLTFLKSKQEKEDAAKKQAEAKKQELKKTRAAQVVQLTALYNQTYNAQRGGSSARARFYAMDFVELYEKDADYFKSVDKMGHRASGIYKFLSNEAYLLPNV